MSVNFVIARSKATKQSSSLPKLWIASRSPSTGGAAPVIGRVFARPVGADPLARNDGISAPPSLHHSPLQLRIGNKARLILPENPVPIARDEIVDRIAERLRH